MIGRFMGSIAVLAGSLSAFDAHAADSARYELRIELVWSAETHPHEFPDDPHWSGMFGATHNSRIVVFGDGRTASTGLELVAENGRSGSLEAEFKEGRRRNRIGTPFASPGLPSVPGEMKATFEIDTDRPRVSFVTMIAPSPDWFTGVAGVSLLRDAEWVDRLEVTLWAWDAGTDSGATYAAEDEDTQPRESVRLVATPHFLDDAGLKPVGKATFVRLE